MKRRTIFLAALALLILAALYNKLPTMRKVRLQESDVSVMYSYIKGPKGFTIDPTDSCFFLIDTAFRTFKSTPNKSADDARIDRIQKALLYYLGDSLTKSLDIRRLATPNKSKEMATLKANTDRALGIKEKIIKLTFSNCCRANDGKNYYYVERVFQENKKGSGDIFILQNGAVQSVKSVWIN
jgi:hypothetical protein